MRTCRRPQLTDRARAGKMTCRGSGAMAPAVCQFGRERLRIALPSSVPASQGRSASAFLVAIARRSVGSCSRSRAAPAGLTPNPNAASRVQADEAVAAGMKVDDADASVEREPDGPVYALVVGVEGLKGRVIAANAEPAVRRGAAGGR
jgi:hypothetical protein